VADLANCLSYLNKTIPNTTADEISLSRTVMDVDYAKRFGPRVYRDIAITSFFTNLLQDYMTGTKIIAEFNHDVFIFMVLRVLMGWEAFSAKFQPHLTMPFLSILHFSFRNGHI
jgi:hypothetical protein